MFRKLLVAVILVLVPALLFAQDGKLRGRVTDSQSGEPLIGANVVVEGTNLGASSDINGDFIILGVPPGVYSLRASYIGYASVTIANIRVNSNVTTTTDFALTSSAIQVEAVEVVAERPLIQRNTTNTVRVNTQDDIKSIAFRGVRNILALEAGVVQQAGNLHVRGGRAGEVMYFVDGANVTNLLFNTDEASGGLSRESVPVIQEALEEVQLQSGGYTADIPGGNSGSVRQTLRTGGKTYSGSLSLQTDDLAAPGSKFLGASSRGWRNVVATFGGPLVLDNLRFFVAGQHNYARSRDAIRLTPFSFKGLKTVQVSGGQPAGRDLPGPIQIKENYLYNNWGEANTAQGSLVYDFSTIKLRFSGSYEENIRKNGLDWPSAIANMFRSQRTTESKTRSVFGSLKATHVLNPTTFYEVSVSFQQRKFKTYDPDFKDNWAAYSDSIANANLGYSGFRSRYQGPLPYGIVTDLFISHENAPNNSYVKNRQDNIGVTVDFTSQLERNIELKVGGNLNAWTMRQWSIGNISNYLRYRYGDDGKSNRTWASEEERRVELARFTNGNINYFGYDVDGREVDSGVDGPRTPLLASAYVQSKFEFQDLVLNLGARLEYYDLDTKTPANPGDYLSWFDSGLDVIDEDKLKDSDPISYLLPRVSFSFPVTENTVFFAQYGRYSQLPALSLLYAGNTFVSRTVSPTSRGNAFLTPVGLLAQPEKTTQYEVGFRQIVSENFALTISGYYKDLQDLISVRKQTNELGQSLYNAYLNRDFGTVKGLELTLELRRTQGLLAKLNYTLADARGTGSNSQSAFGVVESTVFTATPNFIAPLDFNRTHQGSLIIDYRLARGEGGPYLEGFGVNAIFSFNSGRPFTRIAPPTSLGQAQTFEFGVRAISDPRSRVPVEPLNASTGPWNFNLDLAVSKAFYIQDITLEVFLNVLNVFDSKRVQNVFPTTGTPEDDGFLSTPLAVAYRDIPNYVDMYRALNLDNRYFLLRAGGQDVYGAPREVRVGLKVEI